MRRVLWVLVWVLSGCVATQPPNPCAASACGEGRCVVDEGVPRCVCDDARWTDGRCVKPSACDFVSCDALAGSTCEEKDGRASCVCVDGALAHEGSCVARNPCLPNPCSVVRRTTCEVVNGGSQCVCDRGYTPEGNGCSAVPLWTCNTQHTGNGQDSAEPDECPPLASMSARNVSQERTLLPAGDHDWFRITPWVNEITWFTAEAERDDMGLFIEVFDEAGTTLLAEDNRGLQRAGVAYNSLDGAPVMVRVRALGNATGRYTAKYVTLGADDFADRGEDAQHVNVPVTIRGTAQHPRDVDMVWLSLTGGRAFGLRFESTTSRLELQRDGVVLKTLRNAETINATTRFDEEVLLVVRPEGGQGDFTIVTTSNEEDDHSEDVSFATNIDADGAWVAGETTNGGDVDSFTVEQHSGRRYVARWQSLTGATIPEVQVSDASGVFIGRSANGATQFAWLATSDERVFLRLRNLTGGFNTSRYQITVDDLGVDDHSDEFANATPLTFARPVTGAITWAQDVDVFSFMATAGTIVRVDATPQPNDQPPRITVNGPTGQMSNATQTTTVTIVQSAPHFISVGAQGGLDVSRYSVSITNLGTDDHGNVEDAGTPLNIDTWGSGRTQFTGDVDVFTTSLTENVIYRVDFNHTANSREVRVKQNGNWLTDSPLPSDGLFSPLASGAAHVFVTSVTPGDFQVRIATVGLDDVGNLPSTSATLTPSVPRTANIDHGRDVDMFRIPAEARRIYSVATTQPLRIERDNVTGNPLRIARDTEGDLFVRVSSPTQQSGAYQLTATPLGLDDHLGTQLGATPLTLATTVNGTTDFPGDVDTFRIEVPAQRHLRAQCSGCRISVSDGANLYDETIGELFFRVPVAMPVFISVSTETASWSLRVEDLGADDVGNAPAQATSFPVDGVTRNYSLEVPGDRDVFRLALAANDIVRLTSTQVPWVRTPSGAFSARTSFRATVAGDYFVEIFDEALQPGPYTLKAEFGSDDFGNTVATASPLASGVLRNGRMDYDTDVDFFAINGTAGQIIELEATEVCRLRIHTATGTQLRAGYTPMTWLPTSTGPLYVSVTECPEPDYTLLVTY